MAHGVGITYSSFINWNWDTFCFRLCSYCADKKSGDLASTLSALTSYTTFLLANDCTSSDSIFRNFHIKRNHISEGK